MEGVNWFAGIDPGKSGGIALMDECGNVIELFRLEKATELDVVIFFQRALASKCRLHASLEKISAYPLKGMTVGVLAKRMPLVESWGVIWGILTALHIKREQVRASDWQKKMGCLTKGDKKISYRKAQELFPSVKVTHWNADGLLIAENHRREVIKFNGQPA